MSHLHRRQKMGLFARMGGAFDRGAFILEMFGDDLDPDAITAMLGCTPSKS